MTFTPEELAAEQWAPFRDAPIMVSTLGRVKSLAWGRWGLLSPFPNTRGYLQVNWRESGVRRCALVHRMVLEAFLGPAPVPPPGSRERRRKRWQGCHTNGDRRDNRLVNLRWDRPSGNAADKVRHKTAAKALAPYQAVEIHRLLLAGWSARSLAQRFGVSQPAITYISTGRTYGWITGQSTEGPSACERARREGKRVRVEDREGPGELSSSWNRRGEPHYVPVGSFLAPTDPAAGAAGAVDSGRHNLPFTDIDRPKTPYSPVFIERANTKVR